MGPQPGQGGRVSWGHMTPRGSSMGPVGPQGPLGGLGGGAVRWGGPSMGTPREI